jgi:O-acetyl-ADP-ribose deacetylase (regulator of RNase III)
VWEGGGKDEEALLAACYRSALDLAAAHKLASLAFPAISTGVYGYPRDLAAEVAMRATRRALAQQDIVELVRFVLFDEQARSVYEQALRALDDG